MRKFFSTEGVFKTRNLVLMALMVALKVILEPVSTIYLTPSFKLITLSYLPGVITAALLGPWAAVAYGFVADTAGYIARPMGPYFPAYAISEMLTYFIYACFLYKREITWPKILAARVIEVVFIILGLNFLWNSMLYGASASGFYTGARFFNNLLQIPVHVIVTFIVCKFARQMESRAFAGRA